MSDLFDGHTLGKSLKLYFVKNPPDNPENPLHHPKLCVTLNDENVKWGNISDARRELNELLINVLSWADLRIRSNEAFISDAYFTAEDTTHCIDIIEDPLPALEKNQQAKIQGLSMNSDLTESQLALIDVLDELEQTTVNEITEKIEFSQRTVYRCLDALHDIVTLDNGSVEFVTEFVQTGISSLLSKAKNTIESASKGARDKFKLWQESHGVDIEKDDKLIMRFGEIGNNDIDELLRQAQKYYTGEHRVSFAKVTYEKNGQPLAKPLGYNFRR
jgi:Fe2+ or Zn2+ uptake regulation protein